MTTVKNKAASQDCPTFPTDGFKRYLDILLEHHDKFAAAVKGAGSRAARMNDEILESVISSQRSALAFGKTVAENPSDFASNAKAAVELASKAQARAIEFARVLFREQADFGQEIRESLSLAYAAGKDLSEGFKSVGGFTAPWFKTAA